MPLHAYIYWPCWEALATPVAVVVLDLIFWHLAGECGRGLSALCFYVVEMLGSVGRFISFHDCYVIKLYNSLWRTGHVCYLYGRKKFCPAGQVFVRPGKSLSGGGRYSR